MMGSLRDYDTNMLDNNGISTYMRNNRNKRSSLSSNKNTWLMPPPAPKISKQDLKSKIELEKSVLDELKNLLLPLNSEIAKLQRAQKSNANNVRLRQLMGEQRAALQRWYASLQRQQRLLDALDWYKTH